MAVEILREAGVGDAANAADAGHPARGSRQQAVQANGVRPDTAGRASAGGVPAEDEALREVKEFGKSAITWLKGTVPWLQTDEANGAAGSHGGEDSVEWAAGHGAMARTGARGSGLSGMDAAAGSLRPSADSAAFDDGTSRGSRRPDYERNLVREAVAMIQEVLAHPMTWLVISIFVIGGIAMSLADRRPK
ncbi:MAG: hypothetical protein J0L57_05295 [Burkholderiales bacterium]|nr:hypothetical protein [Burkholderiales bacterium]